MGKDAERDCLFVVPTQHCSRAGWMNGLADLEARCVCALSDVG